MLFRSQMTQVMSNMFKQWSQQFTEEQTGKSQATFKQLKLEWDNTIREALKREVDTLQSRGNEATRTLQSQNEQTLTSLSSKLEQRLLSVSSDSLKALERDHASLTKRWDNKFTEALQQQQKLWQSEQSQLMKEMSASVLQSLQGQMTKYENTSTQEQSAALREMGIKLSEQLALEITQRIDTLRQQIHKDFDHYARAWQTKLEPQFVELSQKFVQQHQQEIELLGQESRKDLVKETNSAREQLKLVYASELQKAAQELEMKLASKLEQQKQAMLQEHHKQLGALEAQWKSSTVAALDDMHKNMAESHKQELNKLRVSLGDDYRRELHSASLDDVKEREKQNASVAEKAAASLEARLSAAVKNLEAVHAKRLGEIKGEFAAQNSSEIGRALKNWQETAQQNITAQVNELVSSFETQAAKSAQSIEEKCYLEYRSRLGKMVDELVRRQRDGEATKNAQPKPRKPSR